MTSKAYVLGNRTSSESHNFRSELLSDKKGVENAMNNSFQDNASHRSLNSSRAELREKLTLHSRKALD